jgi:PKD repeat protein
MAEALRGRFKIVAAIILAFVMAVPIGLFVGNAKNAEVASLAADEGVGSVEHNLTISASSGVTAAGPRTVDYRWYDTFNVPFGPWYPRRTLYYAGADYEAIWSDTYPYIYQYYGDSAHQNLYLYSNMRLNITARNLPEVNMDHPVFLPLFGPTRGGNATLNWHMQYLDPAWVQSHYGPSATMYNDGWFVNLTGVTTLDKDAAMAVTGMTATEFDNFGAYWATHRLLLGDSLQQWITEDQANGVFDINNMYCTPFQMIGFGLHGQKIGDKIVLTIYVDCWGMEALMTRWLRAAFMPTEIWMEGFWMNATIGPQTSDIFIKTDVEYGVYAFTSRADDKPVWLWKPLHQDRIESSGGHQKSEFDPYARNINPDTGLPYTYVNWNPGSALCGTSVPYDNTPCAWNLSDNETMSFTWPAGMQQFELDAGPGQVTNVSSAMIISYAEPMPGDYHSTYLKNGSIVQNLASRTLKYTGPIDFWHWSQMQNAANHQALRQQWIDIHGVMLPESTPWVEFGMDMANASTPVARFNVTPISCNITTLLLFNASTSSDPEEPASNLSYRWDFDGNGVFETSWSNESTIQHQYSASGQFAPVLQVRNSKGYVGWVAGSVSVSDLPPVASFAVDPPTGLQTQLFAFDASSSTDLEDAGSALLVRWDWEGNGVWDTGWTTVKTANHQFATPGTYTVGLQVNDSAGLTNTTTRQVIVLPLAIPEFPTVFVPIVGMISLMVATTIFRRRRRSTA